MTIKNDELDRSCCRGAARSRGRPGRPRPTHRKHAAAAQAAPTTDSRWSFRSGWRHPTQSADTNAVSAAQRSLASAQANARSGELPRPPSRTVTAPSSGSIVELNAKVGATVTGGMIMGESDTSGGKQCMQIADLSKMKVTVQVGEKDIAKIAVGPERQRHLSRVSRYREPGHRHGYRLGGKLRLRQRERRQCDL